MFTLEVSLAQRSYPIHIGRNFFGESNELAKTIRARQILLVTDTNVATLYLSRVLHYFRTHCAEKSISHLVIEVGESQKTLANAEQIWNQLAAMKASRDVSLIALGGGVIGDLVGFAAASWMRGVAYIQIPTTLLAQVDSSVGGKTGVNLPTGKNLIGAFHQPLAVFADIETLSTLPAREYRAGLAEVVKYGAIVDADFFTWLETNVAELMAREPKALAYAIERSCAHKASIVARDEFEHGDRAWLNFGHTFGHAIETATQYSRFLHGEAVGIGMMLALRLSHRLNEIERSELNRMQNLLAQMKLPCDLGEQVERDKLLPLMQLDKKNLSGNLRLILLDRIGQARIRSDIDDADIAAVIEHSQ